MSWGGKSFFLSFVSWSLDQQDFVVVQSPKLCTVFGLESKRRRISRSLCLKKELACLSLVLSVLRPSCPVLPPAEDNGQAASFLIFHRCGSRSLFFLSPPGEPSFL